MILLLSSATALALDVALFAGEWAVDPTRSDDPMTALSGLAPRPTATSGDADGYAPDGGGSDEDAAVEARDRMIVDTLGLLGSSGQLTLRPAGDAVALTFAGATPLTLVPGGPWTKIECQEAKCRVRLRDQGDRLVLERRIRSTRLLETLLPPEEGGTIMAAVVHVEASAIARPIEFRRVYRSIGP